MVAQSTHQAACIQVACCCCCEGRFRGVVRLCYPGVFTRSNVFSLVSSSPVHPESSCHAKLMYPALFNIRCTAYEYSYTISIHATCAMPGSRLSVRASQRGVCFLRNVKQAKGTAAPERNVRLCLYTTLSVGWCLAACSHQELVPISLRILGQGQSILPDSSIS